MAGAVKDTWKKQEAKVAKWFGCLRQRLSGSSGRADETNSDTTHPNLYIEVKYRTRNFPNPQLLLDDCRKKCTGVDAGKTPCLALVTKGKPGFLIVVHSSDFVRLAGEILSERINDGYQEEDG